MRPKTMKALSGPNDVSQFAPSVKIESPNEGLYYCDGRPKFPHSPETIFSRVVLRYQDHIMIQCRECKSIYTVPVEARTNIITRW